MRNFIRCCTLFALFACSSSFAQSPPSKESLDKLLEVSKVHDMIPQMQAQLDGIISGMSRDIVKDRTITPEQQKALDVYRDKVLKIGKEEISWALLEPRIIDIYSTTLSQEDVDGIIAFYQSPAGVSFIKKMPEIMKQTMLMMQKTSVPMMKKIEAAAVELQQDLQAIPQKP